ncbi:AbrB/MazE/SpoVT family DNA-binding domain-containing protein [Alicyclobacillus fastidiosus]|uniref:AbrB/MazE/SpoVT family DNA-binding domain-containing protein n=1 Tax=Alicyclobacillus fastidiosus TaxID=392011 RepID=A0ABY6ZD30_9BACL|nr:AbrB/MazE/SpoVT family DNA-binding domain-containing protein [Alicyclobacillus fastidiosus]WAH40645.1 AbrB/MazE/SpoVT family DNA-binding domain-containing protein [Alicyclobacillus fastidiosus]GMA62095.1 hypothetical protein GCM10025859_25350 [Alicyclobacillus fastidiosus]
MIQMDDSGCVTIPHNVREAVGILADDCLTMWIDTDAIVLQKVEPRCVICNGTSSAVEFKVKLICVDCIHDLRFFYGTR